MKETLKINNGIVILNKEKGMTSHDAIFKLKKILNIKKIGHTGTLDKNASGVLVVLLSNSTKIQNTLMKGDKEYIAELIIGVLTDTEDYTGRIVGDEDESLMFVKKIDNFDKNDEELNQTIEKIKFSIDSFIGEYEQIPPMFSSKKVGGKKLLNMAYKGETIERKPCKVKINSIEILDYYYKVFKRVNVSVRHINENNCHLNIKINKNNEYHINNLENKNNEKEYLAIKIRVNCSKGTYIRTLCKDIGNNISLESIMGDLVRTKNTDFSIDESFTLDEISNKIVEGNYSFIKPAYYLDSPQVVTFGKFETLHIGHKKIIDKVLALKKEYHIESTVLLVNTINEHFDKNHNLTKGKIESAVTLTREQQYSKLKYYGIDNILDFEINDFNKDYTPEFFVEEILIKQMNAKTIVVGSDCSFGKKGIGNKDTLKNIASKYNVDVVVIDKIKLDDYCNEWVEVYGNKDISSTLIKKAFLDNNIDLVNKCLGKKE